MAGRALWVLNKDKIIKAEIYDSQGRTVISTKTLEFPKDFFSIKSSEFVVFKGTNILPINKGEKIEAVFYYINGTRIKYKTVIDLATDMQVNIHLGNDYVVMEERRRYFKTETNISGIVKALTRGEETLVFEKPVQINIKNINIGGVFMMSPYEFELADIINLCFLDNRITIDTEILRVQTDKENKITGYGCRFKKLPTPDEEIIARFIFELQVAEREKRKRMYGR